MSKQKLTSSETAILRELIFAERFDHIQTETGLTFGAIRDDLIKLINHGYIEVHDEEYGPGPSAFYDSDNIDKFSFKATKQGLKRIQNHAI
jgi:hypothetical protein